MTDLIASLGAGKGTWTQVNAVLSSNPWSNVFVVSNSFGAENFKPSKKVEFVVVDDLAPIPQLVLDISAKLRGRVKGNEVAVNFASGSGNLHMALLSALLKLGLGIRLMSFENGTLAEI